MGGRDERRLWHCRKFSSLKGKHKLSGGRDLQQKQIAKIVNLRVHFLNRSLFKVCK